VLVVVPFERSIVYDRMDMMVDEIYDLSTKLDTRGIVNCIQ
jgi:hypothetical protein